MSETFVEKLICSKCGREYSPSSNPLMCINKDRGRLDIVYDYSKIMERLTKDELKHREVRGVWRYWELLPVKREHVVSLGEGDTPLIKSERLAERLGLKKLYLKDETRNPSSSFKDRAMTVGVSKAVEIKTEVVVTASSGNAAAALAAYSARSGLKCVAFVPEDVAAGKVSQLLLYGAKVFRVRQVEEGVDPTVQLMILSHERLNWYTCPSFGPFNPYQVEGPKTMLYEIVEQLGWRSPDFIFVPTGSGCLITGLWKACIDLEKVGLMNEYPRLVLVQPVGNMPLVDALKRGLTFSEIKPTPYPNSIASGLLDPYPWDGDLALDGVRKTGGVGVAVSDEEIMNAVKMLAGLEGVFAEPSGAAGLAALVKLLDEGVVSPSDESVVLVTGSGLKEPEKIMKLYPETPLIGPNLDEVLKRL
jgi:threonine synthase